MKNHLRGREIAERVQRNTKWGDEGAVAAWLLVALDEIDAFAEERAAYAARISALEAELKVMRETSYAASA